MDPAIRVPIRFANWVLVAGVTGNKSGFTLAAYDETCARMGLKGSDSI
jgi:hypothetical protein